METHRALRAHSRMLWNRRITASVLSASVLPSESSGVLFN